MFLLLLKNKNFQMLQEFFFMETRELQEFDFQRRSYLKRNKLIKLSDKIK